MVLALLAALCAAPARAGTTTRVSVASDGSQGNDVSGVDAITPDGRYVAFTSNASNLVPGDTNGRSCDVFVRDQETGATERVSVASGGAQGNWDSGGGRLSADGRYVAFDSRASNLVPGDTNECSDVFVHDRVTGVTERVSVASDGGGGADRGGRGSRVGGISADGRYVAFDSRANDLVPGDTNDATDVFVHDRVTGITERVSVASDGRQGSRWDGSDLPVLSANGRYVAFGSTATNLVPGDTNGCEDIFVHDRVTGATERVSVASDGLQSNYYSHGGARISTDGRYVAFSSSANNLVPGDTNGCEDIFVHDRVTGTTERISVASGGGQASGTRYGFAISADGRLVAFDSDANNVTPGDTNGARDVFVHDRLTGVTERVSVASDGGQTNGASGVGGISADGRYVAFGSTASNLVAGDTNGTSDAFVYDRGPGPYPPPWTYPAGTTVTAKDPYTPSTPDQPHVPMLKGQLHCHWYDDVPAHLFTVDPIAMELLYRMCGFSFMALTEHTLDGHGRTPPAGVESSRFAFIEQAAEVTAKAALDGLDAPPHLLAVGVAGDVVYDDRYQDMIDSVLTQGGLAFIPHPESRRAPYPLPTPRSLVTGELRALTGYSGLCVFNGAQQLDMTNTWDVILRCQKQIQTPAGNILVPAFAEDDYTPPGWGYLGGYRVTTVPAGTTWIALQDGPCDRGGNITGSNNAERSESIKRALRTGRWWSYWTANGVQWGAAPFPELRLSLDLGTKKVSVTSTHTLDEIHFIGAVNRGTSGDLCEPAKDTDTASFTFSGGEIYIRVWAVYTSANGKRLTIASNPISVYPTGPVNPYGPSSLAPARVQSLNVHRAPVSSLALVLTYVEPDHYPAASPPLGYIRHVYNVTAAGGALPAGAVLTLSYAGEDVTAYGLGNLRVWHYNVAAGAWEALNSTIDTAAGEVTAEIPALGLYTISAVPVEDAEAPSVSFLLPAGEGAAVTGTTTLMAMATDNVGVSHVTFSLNGRQIATDSCGEDGWRAEADLSHTTTGNYTLAAEATDLRGNAGTATRAIALTSEAAAPVVTCSTRLPGSPPAAPVTFRGTVRDADSLVQSVVLLLDDSLIGVATVYDSGLWTCVVPAEAFPAGGHTLVVKATDEWGNEGTAAQTTLADLMVKRESDAAYAGYGVYQTAPIGVQVKSQPVAPGAAGRTCVRLQNKGSIARAFVLRASEVGSTGWSRLYQYGAEDVTARITGADGFTTPVLAGGSDSDTLVIEMRPPALSVPGAMRRAVVKVSPADTPALVGDAVQTTTTVSAVNRPDLQIRAGTQPDSAYGGDNLYQITPSGDQVEGQSASPTAPARYWVRVQNDGNVTRTFLLRAGQGGTIGWTISYRLGTEDITAAITGAGGYTTPPIAGFGRSMAILVEVTPGPKIQVSARKAVTVRAYLDAADRTLRDAVEAGTTALLYDRPDLLIKSFSQSDDAFGGGGVYQPTPSGDQVETQATAAGTPARYSVKIRNDGNTYRPFLLKAVETAETGWTVVYKRGSIDITAAMRGAGFAPSTIAAFGGSLTLTVEMTPGPSVRAGTGKRATVNVLHNATDTIVRDAVRATATRSQ